MLRAPWLILSPFRYLLLFIFFISLPSAVVCARFHRIAHATAVYDESHLLHPDFRGFSVIA